MTGGMAAPAVPLGCTGPVSYTGHERLRARPGAAPRGGRRRRRSDPDQVFVCAVAPSGVGGNEYYPTEAAYLDAVADALHEEYAAIVDGGLHPADRRPVPHRRVQLRHRVARQDTLETGGLYVNAINRSLRGIPPERVRLHTCYGINEGPRVHDAPLAEY